MFRLIGRLVFTVSGVFLLQLSNEFPWWGTLISVVIGLIIVQQAYRDGLREEGSLK